MGHRAFLVSAKYFDLLLSALKAGLPSEQSSVLASANWVVDSGGIAGYLYG